MKKILIGLSFIAILTLAAIFWHQNWSQSGFAAAEAAIEKNEFAKARVILERHQSLILGNSADRSKMDYLLAISYLSDINLEPKLATEKALPMLESIPRESEFFSEAQVALAKHWLFVVAMPKRAEELCLRALEAESDNLEAKDLLFTIYSATNDPVKADKAFWSAFPDAPQHEKVSRFQQWFCSQFTRNTANASIDQVLSVVDTKGELFTIFNRLILFKNQEPDEGQHFAALADWWLSQDETKTAIEVLAKGREVAKHVANGRFLGSFSDVLIRQGELELASNVLKSWPQDERDFKYWRNLGVLKQTQAGIVDDNQKLYREAAEAFEKACESWPSSIDPNLFHRMQICYTELGQPDKAQTAQDRDTLIRAWMEDKWQLVSRGISFLETPAGTENRQSESKHDISDQIGATKLLIEFFQAIERSDAVTFLKEHLASLEK